ncbi:enoyl-CoA hydratase/isomerase family protein [Novosphingobium sp. FKTRR1]|uniref:enoyl-CoA hydratase/isomerase family protein n=1 Tax=Novosphingobium sp. FKTRR1 TaxID=2879118 RepID=UPI001CF02D0B
MSYDTILFEVADHVATITINRPEAMNSFNRQMMDEFAQVWHEISWNDDIHVSVLRAAPGRAFCTGVDVKGAVAGGDQRPAVDLDNIWHCEDPGDLLGPKSRKCWKPMIAAVHGMAAGGAFYWLNEADIIIASEDATFFDPHVTYGMTSALEPIGMTYKMPLADVLRMVLLGNDERMSAEYAKSIGLVSEILPLDRLWARAHELALQIAAKPPAAIQGSIKAIWTSLDLPRSVALAGALRFPQIGNPVGVPQVDRGALMADKSKKYTLR